jgi:hypothetical protein
MKTLYIVEYRLTNRGKGAAINRPYGSDDSEFIFYYAPKQDSGEVYQAGYGNTLAFWAADDQEAFRIVRETLGKPTTGHTYLRACRVSAARVAEVIAAYNESHAECAKWEADQAAKKEAIEVCPMTETLTSFGFTADEAAVILKHGWIRHSSAARFTSAVVAACQGGWECTPPDWPSDTDPSSGWYISPSTAGEADAVTFADVFNGATDLTQGVFEEQMTGCQLDRATEQSREEGYYNPVHYTATAKEQFIRKPGSTLIQAAEEVAENLVENGRVVFSCPNYAVVNGYSPVSKMNREILVWAK